MANNNNSYGDRDCCLGIGINKKMKAGTMEEIVSLKNKRIPLVVLLIIAVALAVLIMIALQGLGLLFNNLAILIRKYWPYILGGLGALLLARKIFFRKRVGVQEMRIVR